jgi:hypothetical protein
MISSPEINKVLRKNLSPILRQNGFSHVQPRRAWGWHGPCVWVLEIRAVGNYFSVVTGWPPMSVVVSTGVYYDFIPDETHTVSADSQGHLCPREYLCHARYQLERGLNQDLYQSTLSTRPERDRRDIWWITPTGENTREVVDDIAHGFVTRGLRWFNEHTDLENAFHEIERGHDCYIKFYQAAHLARHLGYEAKHQAYLERLNRERERIGRTS